MRTSSDGDGYLDGSGGLFGSVDRQGVAIWAALIATALLLFVLVWLGRGKPLSEAWAIWVAGLVVLAGIWLFGPPTSSLRRMRKRQKLAAKAKQQVAAMERIEKGVYRWAKEQRLGATDLSRARLVEMALKDAWHRPLVVGEAKTTAFCFGERESGLISSFNLRAPERLPQEVSWHLLAYKGKPKRLPGGGRVQLCTRMGALIEVAHRLVSATYKKAEQTGKSPCAVAGSVSLKEAIGHDGLCDLLVASFAHSNIHDGLVHRWALESAISRHTDWIFPDEPVTAEDVAAELTMTAAAVIGKWNAHVPLKRTIDDWRAARRRAREEKVASRQGRPGLALGLGILATAGLVPGFYFLAPASQWSDAWLLLVMGGVAVLATLMAAGVVGATSALDPTFICALVVLVFAGPLPATLILIGTEIVAWFVTRHRGSAFFANVAALGWYPLAGAVLLVALVKGLPGAPAAYPAIVAAGFLMLSVNFLVTRGIVAVVRDGRSIGLTIRNEYLKLIPAHLVMYAIAVGTVFLYTVIGLPALALFALAALVPPLYIPHLVRRTDPYRIGEASLEDLALDVAQFAGLKGRELRATEIALPHVRKARMHVAGEGQVATGQTMMAASRMLRDFVETGGKKFLSKAVRERKASDFYAALHAVVCLKEHVDGSGPLHFEGEEIPKAARLLAVVDGFWNDVHVEGKKSETALEEIKAKKETAYDPAMVCVLFEVCAKPEFGLTAERLDRLVSRLPRPEVSPRVRRAIGVLAGVQRGG